MSAPNPSPQANQARFDRALGLGILALLLVGCLLVLLPFLSSLLWAVVLCASLWPFYRRVLAMVRQRRTIAALIMTLAITLALLAPFVIVGFTLADNVKALSTAVRQWLDAGPPAAPQWLARIPMIGAQATEYWNNVASDTARLGADLKGGIEPVAQWLLGAGFKMGRGILQLALSVFIAFFLFRDGASAVEGLRKGAQRIAGERGHRMLQLALDTIRSVVYGILGTALVQGALAGVGFFIAGVPGATLLALLTFFLSVMPVGPPLVWIPASIWLYHQGHTGWAIFMFIWGIGVSSVDNVVKPWLISRGSALPFLLIFFGVIGGALAFGFIGVFLGPTMLAVGYRLLQEWSSLRRAEAEVAQEL